MKSIDLGHASWMHREVFSSIEVKLLEFLNPLSYEMDNLSVPSISLEDLTLKLFTIWVILKVGKFQKCISLFSFEPKTEQNFYDSCPKDLK